MMMDEVQEPVITATPMTAEEASATPAVDLHKGDAIAALIDAHAPAAPTPAKTGAAKAGAHGAAQ
jgi:hypothetical protein